MDVRYYSADGGVAPDCRVSGARTSQSVLLQRAAFGDTAECALSAE
jgi:hypothetical protein